MKTALVLAEAKMDIEGLDYMFVCNVHDEMQVEASSKDAERIGEIMVHSIVLAGQRLGIRCPLDGEYKTGQTWAETH